MDFFITEQTAKRKLWLVCEFARGMQAERDRLKARQELVIVNRQLYSFGYGIEPHNYERDLYLPLQGSTPLASITSMSWCCRMIFTRLGIAVRPRRKEELESEFYKKKRDYRRACYIGAFVDIPQLDDIINRRQFS